MTSAGHLSVGFAGLMTAVAVASGIAIQPVARRLETRRRLAGNVSGLVCATAGLGLAAVVVAASSRAGAVVCAVLCGLAYGQCLVSGLRECERLADRREHGAVVACYYALTYVGFGAPYLVDGLNGPLGRDRRVHRPGHPGRALCRLDRLVHTPRPGSADAGPHGEVPRGQALAGHYLRGSWSH